MFDLKKPKTLGLIFNSDTGICNGLNQEQKTWLARLELILENEAWQDLYRDVLNTVQESLKIALQPEAEQNLKNICDYYLRSSASERKKLGVSLPFCPDEQLPNIRLRYLVFHLCLLLTAIQGLGSEVERGELCFFTRKQSQEKLFASYDELSQAIFHLRVSTSAPNDLVIDAVDEKRQFKTYLLDKQQLLCLSEGFSNDDFYAIHLDDRWFYCLNAEKRLTSHKINSVLSKLNLSAAAFDSIAVP